MVDSALRSSRRMSRLVADLLLLARADAGRLGTHRRCDLAEIAGNAAAEVAPLMGDRELRDRERAAAAGRGQPRRAAPDGPQPARQRRPPHARRAHGSSCACARDGGDARGRGRRRRPRHPARACASRSSTASSAARARPTPPSAPAAASAWRSSAPSPPPTAARSRSRESAARRRPASASGCPLRQV